jgi:transcription antitermination factor NusG
MEVVAGGARGWLESAASCISTPGDFPKSSGKGSPYVPTQKPMLAQLDELPPQRPDCAPPLDDPDAGTWFVLHTKSNLEWRLAKELSRIGLEYFLPTYQKVIRTADRRRTVSILPLFKNYLFLRGNEHAPGLAYGTFKIRNVINVVNQKRIRADLANLELALGINPRAEPCGVVQGRRYRVAEGPFEGVIGKVVERGKDTLIVLSVDPCGSVVMEIDSSKLEPL